MGFKLFRSGAPAFQCLCVMETIWDGRQSKASLVKLHLEQSIYYLTPHRNYTLLSYL